MIKFIGATFPKTWLWSQYEQSCIDSIFEQIDICYPHDNNLFINLTWFGPQFNNGQWEHYQKLKDEKFDNLFLLSSVDPSMINNDQINNILNELGNPRLFKLGNFDTEYHFNFFAPILQQHFRRYADEDLLLNECKWVYINYNRKPRQHRVDLVKQLIDHDLVKYGIVTLGKPNQIYDKDPDNCLFLTVGEKCEDYIEHGHWYGPGPDEFGIPHDVLSLHNMNYWQHHFLNVVSATEFNVWDDIFVSETQFKPIIGLRPFVINGNTRTYQWLRDNGFRTFNHYWPEFDLENSQAVHQELINLIKYLCMQDKQQLVNMYTDMLPDLYHNRNRFMQYATEQHARIKRLLC
jgi:hypothetical protein